jgi:hypothetical protein
LRRISSSLSNDDTQFLWRLAQSLELSVQIEGEREREPVTHVNVSLGNRVY